MIRALCFLVVVVVVSAARAQPVTIRVASFNVADLRTDELADPDTPRARYLAEVIQRLRPNVILLNEIAYDMPGGPDVPAEREPGRNAQRFAEAFLAVAQAPDCPPVRFKSFTAPTNTGIPSGFDLDNNGRVVSTFPPPAPRGSQAKDPAVSDEARDYGDDCWGWGTFPGQYGMALLVDARLEILHDRVRTFQRLPWDYMPGAMLPEKADGTPWYAEETLTYLRLSSKSHWDVPVRLPNGAVVHFLCSHPTPPVYDGPEKRNARRNHDEIRFWADYIDGEPYIVDDNNRPGGLAWNASFIILGDLNADPKKGEAWRDPVGTFLFTNRRLARDPAPRAEIDIDGLDPLDTAMFGLRVDYVLPSRDLEVIASGVWRTMPSNAKEFPSDHFPVWIDVTIPPPRSLEPR